MVISPVLTRHGRPPGLVLHLANTPSVFSFTPSQASFAKLGIRIFLILVAFPSFSLEIYFYHFLSMYMYVVSGCVCVHECRCPPRPVGGIGSRHAEPWRPWKCLLLPVGLSESFVEDWVGSGWQGRISRPGGYRTEGPVSQCTSPKPLGSLFSVLCYRFSSGTPPVAGSCPRVHAACRTV